MVNLDYLGLSWIIFGFDGYILVTSGEVETSSYSAPRNQQTDLAERPQQFRNWLHFQRRSTSGSVPKTLLAFPYAENDYLFGDSVCRKR